MCNSLPPPPSIEKNTIPSVQVEHLCEGSNIEDQAVVLKCVLIIIWKYCLLCINLHITKSMITLMPLLQQFYGRIIVLLLPLKFILFTINKTTVFPFLHYSIVWSDHCFTLSLKYILFTIKKTTVFPFLHNFFPIVWFDHCFILSLKFILFTLKKTTVFPFLHNTFLLYGRVIVLLCL